MSEMERRGPAVRVCTQAFNWLLAYRIRRTRVVDHGAGNGRDVDHAALALLERGVALPSEMEGGRLVRRVDEIILRVCILMRGAGAP